MDFNKTSTGFLRKGKGIDLHQGVTPKGLPPLVTKNHMMKDFFITSLTPEEQLRAKEEELRLVKLTNTLEDPKTKYAMKKLHSTLDRLKKMSEQCKFSLSKSMSTSQYNSRLKTADTFNLTRVETTFSRSRTNADLLLSITGEDLFSPKAEKAIEEVIRDIEYDPKSAIIADHLWSELNIGRKYYNELKYESGQLDKQVESLTESLRKYNIVTDNSHLENQIKDIKPKIEEAYNLIKMDEMKVSQLDNMLTERKRDMVIRKQRCLILLEDDPRLSSDIAKKISDLLDINKELESHKIDFDNLQTQLDWQNKRRDKLSQTAMAFHSKGNKFQETIQAEGNFLKKRKDYIIKVKKENEEKKHEESELAKADMRQKLAKLKEMKKIYEADFEKLSKVSKNFESKQDFISYYEDLESRNKHLNEEVINIRRDIADNKKTLLAKLTEQLANAKFTTENPSSDNIVQLKQLAQEKARKTSNLDRDTEIIENIYQSCSRGIVSLFYLLVRVKEQIGLEKLDHLQLNMSNLSEVFTFCGEVIATVSKTTHEFERPKSQPVSSVEFISDDEF